MDFSQLLLEFLKKNGSVYVTGFGEFYLKKTNAFVDKKTQNILPPGKEVAFRNEITGNGKDFIRHISSQKNISELEADIEIKKQVAFWNSKLEKEGEYFLDNFGSFFLQDSKISFQGIRTEDVSPDFYGLEEINISEITNNFPKNENELNEKSYKFPRSVYWIIPLVIGVLALTYFGITQPEKIFGRKSFSGDLQGKSAGEIKKDSRKKHSLIKDSTIINSKLDSLKTDSLESAKVSNKTPVKKWSAK